LKIATFIWPWPFSALGHKGKAGRLGSSTAHEMAEINIKRYCNGINKKTNFRNAMRIKRGKKYQRRTVNDDKN
jgi:hypothetical protein